MTTYQIIGIVGSALLALAGIIKFELIRAWIRKLTDADTAQAKVISIIALIAVSVIPAMAGFSIPETTAKEEEPKEEQQSAAKRNTKEGEIIDATTEGVVTLSRLSAEIAEQVKEDRKDKNNAYLAAKGNRWVYKIGDAMISNDAILSLYIELKEKDAGRISLFKDRRKHFFFVDPCTSKGELEGSIEDLQEKVGSSAKVEIVDLMEWGSPNKPNIVMVEPVRGKKKKEKIEVACFAFER